MHKAVRKAILALLASCLAVTTPFVAVASDGPSSETLSGPLQVLVDAQGSIAAEAFDAVQLLQGYALADELDNIGRDARVLDILTSCANYVKEMAYEDIKASLSEAELKASMPPSLVSRVDELVALLDVAFDIVTRWTSGDGEEEAILDLDAIDLSKAYEAHVARIDDQTRPIAERRLLRHSVRGMSAMLCMLGQPKSVELQAELLDHAIVGYRSLLRLATAAVNETERERIVELGLQPVDLEDWNRQAEELLSAEVAIREARRADPSFCLLPISASESPRD